MFSSSTPRVFGLRFGCSARRLVNKASVLERRGSPLNCSCCTNRTRVVRDPTTLLSIAYAIAPLPATLSVAQSTDYYAFSATNCVFSTSAVTPSARSSRIPDESISPEMSEICLPPGDRHSKSAFDLISFPSAQKIRPRSHREYFPFTRVLTYAIPFRCPSAFFLSGMSRSVGPIGAVMDRDEKGY